MRVVIQRVSKASVTVNQKKVAQINKGLLVLLGITDSDTQEDIDYLVRKIANLRIFNDENYIMNLSLKDLNADVIVVSQFTLYANTKKGNRPSYINASKPNIATPLYEKFIVDLEVEIQKEIQTGEFGADMKVHLLNDGPITIIIDSKNREF
jgi:D-aminoacyl-tRNA deacylase